MGRKPGGERKSFVGESTPDGDTPASLEQALLAAAESAVESRFVRKPADGDATSGPLWFDVTGFQVEIANQHVRTMRVIVTER